MTNEETQGMAECMEILRCDLIAAGIVSERIPPMFYSEAIIALVKSMHQEIVKLREQVKKNAAA